jgi:hypothetical protein
MARAIRAATNPPRKDRPPSQTMTACNGLTANTGKSFWISKSTLPPTRAARPTEKAPSARTESGMPALRVPLRAIRYATAIAAMRARLYQWIATGPSWIGTGWMSMTNGLCLPAQAKAGEETATGRRGEWLGSLHPHLVARPADGLRDSGERGACRIEGNVCRVRAKIDPDRLHALDLADRPRNTGGARSAGHAFNRDPHVLTHRYIESSRPKLIATTPKARMLLTTAPLCLFQRPRVPRTRRFETASKKMSSGTIKATL